MSTAATTPTTPAGDLTARALRLEAFAAQDPANLALLRDLAETWHRAGEHARALGVVERAEAVPGGAAQCAGLKGQVLLALGRWSDACALFEAALAGAPESAAVTFNLGYALWASGVDVPRAVEMLRRAASLDPGNPDVLVHLALALEEAGAADEAADALERALALSPRHARALATLGRLRMEAGEFDRASALADACIGADSRHAAGWYLKGQAALFGMDPATAAKCLRQALDLDPEDVETRVALAQASLMQGRARHARTLCEEAAARDAGHGGALCMLGWACVADNDAPAAATAFGCARAVAPDDADALAGLAFVTLSENHRDEALALAQQALALEPEHAMARLLVARARELDGRPGEARELLDSVLRSTPFGPLRSTFGEAVQASAASPTVRRLQRRFAGRTDGARNPSDPSR